MTPALLTALIEVGLKVEPIIAAGIARLVLDIHKKKNRPIAVQKAQDAVDTEEDRDPTDLEN